MTNTTVATIGHSANALFKRDALQIVSIRRLRDQRDQLTKELLAARGDLGGARQTIARQQSLIGPLDRTAELWNVDGQQNAPEIHAPQENYFARDFGSWGEDSAEARPGCAASRLEMIRAVALKAKRDEIALSVIR
jgi:hypothetical protein